jgi:uncharacterized membrane-anchored protein YitT (DUF2179 family)
MSKVLTAIKTWVRTEVRDYLFIFIGINLTALSLVLFLVPNKIAAGGVSGLATILYYLWSWPVGLVIFILNIPLLIACLRVFGARFGAKTFFGATFLSLAIEFWSGFTPSVTKDPLLASLFGGVLAGAGMGITFRFHGTTGGTDLAAQLIHRYTGLPVGRSLYIIDGCIVLLAGLVFRSPEAALYALIALVVTGRAIDTVLEGLNFTKAALIISTQADRIAERILHDLGRGVTGLNGRGLYSGEAKEVLLCIVGRSEELRLKEMIRREDPAAFMIITDVREVLGEGFGKFTSL